MLICLHMNTVRTSLVLPTTLHQRLAMAAKYADKTISEMVRELLDSALASQEQGRIAHTYEVLRKVEGICKDKITDASTTINETLYGEHGAWKPKEE